MTDVIELLRAHDPERDGAAAPPIEPLLGRLGEEPDPRRSSPRRRGRVAVAVALACLAVIALVAVALGGGGGGDRRDALVPADGAVVPGPVIVHTISRTTIALANGRRGGASMDRIGTMDGPVERWSTTGPPRWREVATLLPGRDMPGGTIEQAYADGAVRFRQSWKRRSELQRPHSAEGGLAGFSIGAAAMSASARALITGVTDPRAAIDAMVESGEMRRAGATTRHGRPLLRLIAVREGSRRRGGGIVPASQATFLVDAETYVPVEASTAIDLDVDGSGPHRFTTQSRTVFDVYENLPLTAKTAALLRFGGR